MKRIRIFRTLFLIAAIIVSIGCARETAQDSNMMMTFNGQQPLTDVPDTSDRVTHTDAEWHKLLTPEQYYVLREQGTERAFTGTYVDNHEHGMYVCAACGNPLFSSDTKFESGTGWPSFWAPIEPGRVHVSLDNTLGMVRDEVTCNRCGSHLGHVFDDGPKPTGLRYCMNSVALDFHPGK